MQLTSIPDESLPRVLEGFGRAVAKHGVARMAFDRIAASCAQVSRGADLPADRRAAVVLARSFGIPTLDEPPSAAYSWDGNRLRVRSEASVIVHEVAHWQICPPERRALPDFGLGAGPETGEKAAADSAVAADFATREGEERLASLLGILWEAELGQPAILAFLEQNWLEGWKRPAAAEAFVSTIETLHDGGFIDADGRPTRRVHPSGVRPNPARANA